jgi:UDP-N-acetylmuramoyl-tripeptide--D-alanyl-D-alanine ligase
LKADRGAAVAPGVFDAVAIRDSGRVKHEPLWRWQSLAQALGQPSTSGPDITGISIDSRTLEPGDLFIALKGDPGPRFNTGYRSTRDGHDFVDAALARGAAGVVVSREPPPGVSALRVHDTLNALWDLGAAARQRFGGRVFAVTGSSGKTTAKTFLAAALGCPSSAASYNNHLGVPLSLARTEATAAAAVFEIGTNHPGEIGPLAALVQPHVALVLNVGQAHLENFPDWDALRREKLAISGGLVEGGTLVVPEDLDISGVRGDVRVLRFGRGAHNFVRLLEVRKAPWREVGYSVAGRTVVATVPGGGVHRATTLAAALCCLAAADAPLERALQLDDALVPAGRGRRHTLSRHTVIDDSYNANPASMTAALVALAAEPGPKIAILGEMLELGAGSVAAHRGLAAHCESLDGVWCVGVGMRALFEALPADKRLGWVERAADLEDAALARLAAAPATILVKGSNRVFWVHAFVPRLIARLEAAH